MGKKSFSLQQSSISGLSSPFPVARHARPEGWGSLMSPEATLGSHHCSPASYPHSLLFWVAFFFFFSPHLQKFLANHIMEIRAFWLGLSDMQREGDWEWLDGQSLSISYVSKQIIVPKQLFFLLFSPKTCPAPIVAHYCGGLAWKKSTEKGFVAPESAAWRERWEEPPFSGQELGFFPPNCFCFGAES